MLIIYSETCHFGRILLAYWQVLLREGRNILISNTDYDLRNHGFLYDGPTGWRLSPAYDLSPVPTDFNPRILNAAINQDNNTASLELAMDVAGYFELKPSRLVK